MKFIPHPSPNWAERPPETSVNHLIIHYTACDLAESLKILTDRGSDKPVSAHYLIDEVGDVYQLVDEARVAWHAGVSFWRGRQSLNAWSIGIELVNPGCGPCYRDFPQAQMEALLAVSHGILKRHPIPPPNVLGHSDIAPSRKVDPGERFDWAWMAQNGVGAYPPLKAASCREGAGVLQVQSLLQEIGYDAPISGLLDSHTANVVRAFQMHFMSGNVDGLITQALVERLEQVKTAPCHLRTFPVIPA